MLSSEVEQYSELESADSRRSDESNMELNVGEELDPSTIRTPTNAIRIALSSLLRRR